MKIMFEIMAKYCEDLKTSKTKYKKIQPDIICKINVVASSIIAGYHIQKVSSLWNYTKSKITAEKREDKLTFFEIW